MIFFLISIDNYEDLEQWESMSTHTLTGGSRHTERLSNRRTPQERERAHRGLQRGSTKDQGLRLNIHGTGLFRNPEFQITRQGPREIPQFRGQV